MEGCSFFYDLSGLSNCKTDAEVDAVFNAQDVPMGDAIRTNLLYQYMGIRKPFAAPVGGEPIKPQDEYLIVKQVLLCENDKQLGHDFKPDNIKRATELYS